MESYLKRHNATLNKLETKGDLNYNEKRNMQREINIKKTPKNAYEFIVPWQQQTHCFSK